jgi:hypothetical protein
MEIDSKWTCSRLRKRKIVNTMRVDEHCKIGRMVRTAVSVSKRESSHNTFTHTHTPAKLTC